MRAFNIFLAVVAVFLFSSSVFAGKTYVYEGPDNSMIRVSLDDNIKNLGSKEIFSQIRNVLIVEGYKKVRYNGDKKKIKKYVGVTTNHSYSPTTIDEPLALVIYYTGYGTTDIEEGIKRFKKSL